ncbi:hypothetical protein [Lacrimispora sp.]|uniref:hypothetical protein n=1 Tax=Lacrimispora sp. TaxID=2719234 RepID=UPI0028A9AD4A|nr:hypothetical protein [Lacrimispora sp.]
MMKELDALQLAAGYLAMAGKRMESVVNLLEKGEGTVYTICKHTSVPADGC